MLKARLIRSMILTSALLLLSGLYAQAPDMLWTRTYGTAEINELGQSVNPIKNGGFIIVGVKNHGTANSSIWLIKTNSNGDTTWTKSYGGYGSPAYSSYVEQTADDGYIISGYIAPYNDDKGYQLWLLKTDDAGDTTWTLTYGGSGHDQGRSVQQTADGGYIVTGNTGSGDLLLLKTNSMGEISWTKTYGGDKEDYGNSISLTNDGGYIISGWSSSNTISGNNGFWLIKTNSAGDSSWTLLLEGNNIAAAWSAEQTKDNGYICTGHNGNNKIWLVKVDADGDTTWTKSFGNYGTSQGRDVKETSDGGYIITGFTELYGVNERDLWIIKTDSFGNKLWDKIIANQYDDYGVSIQQTFDDRYLIAGYTETDGSGKYDVWLVRLNSDQGIKYKWHVTSSGSDITGDGSDLLPFLTIQNGINYATNGDTILVQPGTYLENINFNGKNIVVGSLFLTTQDTSYISSTIIDGNQEPQVVSFINGEDSTAVLIGFKIINAESRGIWCDNSNPKITDCLITKNKPGTGRGIWCSYSSPILRRLKVSENGDIGIALMDQSSPLIEDSEISDNDGSGICCDRQCSPFIDNVIIRDNIASAEGGGLSSSFSSPKLNNVLIENNMGGYYGGGGIRCFESSIELINVNIISNTSAEGGGGIVIRGQSNVNAIRCEISNNSSQKNGGAIYCDGSSTLSLINSTISGNVGSGSAIYLQGHYLSIPHVSIKNSVLWNDNLSEVFLEQFTEFSISYSDIRGGSAAFLGEQSGLNFSNLINSDPLYTDTNLGDYSLTSNSPCIDAGDPDLDNDGTTWENDQDDQDLDGTRMDMGAYYFDQTGVDITPPTVPQNLTATPGNQQVTLRWDHNTESDLHKYNIYRDTSSPATTLIDSLVGSPPDTVYIDSGLTNGQIYYYRITAVDDAGNESDFSDEVIATPVQTGTVTDIDGNIYRTVKIGDQWWMSENLKVTHYRNGNVIPNVTDNTEWINLETGAYCEYDNNLSNVETYGQMYNWYSVVDSRNIAPEGWHVPSVEEWQTFIDYLGGDDFAGGKLKEPGTDHWLSPNTGATNSSGFTALPAGLRGHLGEFFSIGEVADFWCLGEESVTGAWNRVVYYNTEFVKRDGAAKCYGFSVRCVKDEVSTVVTTPQNLTATPVNQQITLRWNANIESDLAKYRIYRDTSSPTITLIDSVVGTPLDTFYVDDGLTNGQTYYYRITAVDDAGNESDFSDEVSAIPGDFISPEIQILNPGEDFSIPEYEPLTVTWTATDNIAMDSVLVIYTNEPGVDLQFMGKVPADSSQFTFNVPAGVTDQAMIYLHGWDTSGNDTLVHSPYFSVTDNTPPDSVKIADLDTCAIRDGVTIEWISGDNSGSFRVHYISLSINEKPFTLIDSVDGAVYSYRWIVPNIVSDSCRIKVESFDFVGLSTADTSEYFSIVDNIRPEVEVLTPQEGFSIPEHEDITVTWVATNNIELDYILVSYSKDGGYSGKTMGVVSPDTNYFTFQIPSGVTDSATILIKAKDIYFNTGAEFSPLFSVTDNTPPKYVEIEAIGQCSIGKTKILSWSAEDNTGFRSHQLYFSLDDGAFAWIDSVSGADFQYNWLVPNVMSDRCRIKIESVDLVGLSATDTSDYFSIVDGIPPEIEILTPTEGFSIPEYELLTTTWNATDNIAMDSVQIIYTTGVGQKIHIMGILPSDLSKFSFNIPQGVTDDAMVILHGWDTSGNDTIVYSPHFSVTDNTPPEVDLLTQFSDSSFEIMGTRSIFWAASDNVAIQSIDLAYSTDAGNIWISISENEPNDGEYSWLIPNTPSEQCKIKVTATDSVGLSDEAISDGLFTIYVTYPKLISHSTIISALDTIKLGFSQTLNIELFSTGLALSSAIEENLTCDLQFLNNNRDVYIYPENSFVSGDTISLILSADQITNAYGYGLDGNQNDVFEGSPLDNDTVTVYVNYSGDFDGNDQVDFNDLALFANGWYSKDYKYELGPVTGDIPHFITMTDSLFNIEDAMTFGRMWNWFVGIGKHVITMPQLSLGGGFTTEQKGNDLIIHSRASAGKRIVLQYDQEIITINKKQQSLSKPTDLTFEFYADCIDSNRSEYVHYSFNEEISNVPVVFNIKSKQRDPINIIIGVESIDETGELILSDVISTLFQPIPDKFEVFPNYPNPFNSQTVIEYAIPVQSDVLINIYDLLGRKVKTLTNNRHEAKYFALVWDAKDDHGRLAASGLYFLRIVARTESKTFIKTKKMVMIR